jgi:hypothetical protein
MATRPPHQSLAAETPAPEPRQRFRQLGEPMAPPVGEVDGPVALVDPEVVEVAKIARQLQRLLVHHAPGGAIGPSGDDERSPGLVDEHAVRLVHDGEVQAAQQELADARALARHALELEPQARGRIAEDEPVAQIVEAQLLVRAVGDVASVGRAPRLGRHAADHHADGQSQRAVDRPHRFRVARRQVVVDGDDVHGDAAERGGRCAERGGQGLALPRLHLRHEPGKQHSASDQLHVVVTLADGAPCRLAHECERAGHQLGPEPESMQGRPERERRLP